MNTNVIFEFEAEMDQLNSFKVFQINFKLRLLLAPIDSISHFKLLIIFNGIFILKCIKYLSCIFITILTPNISIKLLIYFCLTFFFIFVHRTNIARSTT